MVKSNGLCIILFCQEMRCLMADKNLRSLLNDILKDLFFKILRLQEKSVSQMTKDSISRTEMHAIEVIQDNQNVTLTQLAEKLGITKATGSVCVSRLVKKDYLEKIKVKKDKRINVLRLTPKGKRCYDRHKDFHDRMVSRLLDEFKMEEHKELIRGLFALYDFFDSLEKELD